MSESHPRTGETLTQTALRVAANLAGNAIRHIVRGP
jgi:hypothetical protein